MSNTDSATEATMSDTETVYTVSDERGVSWRVFDTDRAERLSRSGLTVRARTVAFGGESA